MRIKKRSRWRGMKEDVVNTGTHKPAEQHHQGEARANRNRRSSIERLHCGVGYVTRVQPVNLTRPDGPDGGNRNGEYLLPQLQPVAVELGRG